MNDKTGALTSKECPLSLIREMYLSLANVKFRIDAEGDSEASRSLHAFFQLYGARMREALGGVDDYRGVQRWQPPTPETPVQLMQSTLDGLITEADKYILPVDVKMGAATFRKGVKVGTMLRGLKSHAERQTADAYSAPPAIASLPMQRLQMIADAAKDGASLTWIRAVAEEGLRGDPLAELTSVNGDER